MPSEQCFSNVMAKTI